MNNTIFGMASRGSSFLLLLGCGLALIAIDTGCSRNGPEIIPIRGTITFGGGSWPKPGVLYLTAESPASNATTRPAIAKFDADGNVTVTTFKTGDGLMPGRYRIAVECWEIPPKMGDRTPPKSYVPARYTSPGSSGLALTVEPGQTFVAMNFDVATK